jgi:hypothetical protein
MRKLALAAVTGVLALALAAPATAAPAQVVKEESTFFVGSTCFDPVESIEVTTTFISVNQTTAEGNQIIKVTDTGSVGIGVDSGKTYSVNFGFGTVIVNGDDPGTGGFNSVDTRLTIVDPSTGTTLVARDITGFRFIQGVPTFTHDIDVLNCVGGGS